MVPATPAVAALIPALNAQAETDKQGKLRWFPTDGVWYMWSNIRDDVNKLGGNIDDVGLHTLRHTCITRLGLSGMELQRLSMWAGHSDVSITAKRYNHLNAEALLRGVAILSNPANRGNSTPDTAPSAIQNLQDNGGKRANLGTGTVQ